MTSDKQRSITAILADIKAFTCRGHYLDRLDAIMEELRLHPKGKAAIAPLLQLLERYPDKDFGMPGPIVHFVEDFYKKGYEEQLVKSLKRRPTEHTIWMLNRILNGSKGAKYREYLSLMKTIAASKKPEADIAKEFIEFQDSE